MSQAKVEKYKEEKANRKKIMKREKRRRIASTICGWLVVAVLVGWAGRSLYVYYENNKTYDTIYVDLTAVDDYIDGLDSADE